MNDSRKMPLNLICSIIAFAFNLGMGFFLSPYIVATIGAEANGFVTLAANFISYASLITIALNSMAGRFISLEYHKGNKEKANVYYTSIFIANIIISLVLFIVSVFCVINLENLISISPNLVVSVKWLFAILFFNFIINTFFSVWGVATFVTNRLYLTSLRNMEMYVIQAVVIIGLFFFLTPNVVYKGIATLISTIYSIIANCHYKRTLIPELKLSRSDFDLKKVWELICSGIWVSIGRAGQILLTGVDLLITNIFIDPVSMGIMSLAKVIPNAILNLINTVISVFVPSLVIDYAKEEYSGLVNQMKINMKIIGFISIFPLVILIVYGSEFFRLWVPSVDNHMLYTLSLITCLDLLLTCSVQALTNLFTVFNKVKTYSIVVLILGGISAAVTIVLVKVTGLGIYAIVLTSAIFDVIRNLIYIVSASAKFLQEKKIVYYKQIVKLVLIAGVNIVIANLFKHFLPCSTWLTFIGSVVIVCLAILLVNVFLYINHEERSTILNLIKQKRKR